MGGHPPPLLNTSQDTQATYQKQQQAANSHSGGNAGDAGAGGGSATFRSQDSEGIAERNSAVAMTARSQKSEGSISERNAAAPSTSRSHESEGNVAERNAAFLSPPMRPDGRAVSIVALDQDTGRDDDNIDSSMNSSKHNRSNAHAVSGSVGGDRRSTSGGAGANTHDVSVEQVGEGSRSALESMNTLDMPLTDSTLSHQITDSGSSNRVSERTKSNSTDISGHHATGSSSGSTRAVLTDDDTRSNAAVHQYDADRGPPGGIEPASAPGSHNNSSTSGRNVRRQDSAHWAVNNGQITETGSRDHTGGAVPEMMLHDAEDELNGSP